jgi:hypothetical protein
MVFAEGHVVDGEGGRRRKEEEGGGRRRRGFFTWPQNKTAKIASTPKKLDFGFCSSLN